jgi:hypothetical protein
MQFEGYNFETSRLADTVVEDLKKQFVQAKPAHALFVS